MPTRPVVSDTGPLHYLILIEAAECLAELFARVLIPEIVAVELTHPATPLAVRAWMNAAPSWLDCRSEAGAPRPSITPRDAGERAAIDLAKSVDARLLLIDDRAGDAAARVRGLETTGTLGVLVQGAQLGLVDLSTAVSRLRTTNFRCRPDLLDATLAKYGAGRK